MIHTHRQNLRQDEARLQGNRTSERTGPDPTQTEPEGELGPDPQEQTEPKAEPGPDPTQTECGRVRSGTAVQKTVFPINSRHVCSHCREKNHKDSQPPAVRSP